MSKRVCCIMMRLASLLCCQFPRASAELVVNANARRLEYSSSRSGDEKCIPIQQKCFLILSYMYPNVFVLDMTMKDWSVSVARQYDRVDANALGHPRCCSIPTRITTALQWESESLNDPSYQFQLLKEKKQTRIFKGGLASACQIHKRIPASSQK